MVWASVSPCSWLKADHRAGSLRICAPEKVCPVVVSRKNCPMRSPNPPNPPLEKLNPVGSIPNPPPPPPPKRENPEGSIGNPPPLEPNSVKPPGSYVVGIVSPSHRGAYLAYHSGVPGCGSGGVAACCEGHGAGG